jgi:hypothetical protein
MPLEGVERIGCLLENSTYPMLIVRVLHDEGKLVQPRNSDRAREDEEVGQA